MKLNSRGLTENDWKLLESWWVISDHKGNKRARPLAVKLLIETAEELVKAAGKKCLMSISRSNSLLKIHKKLGWTIDETPSHEMIKRII
jgi:hypothetical protein